MKIGDRVMVFLPSRGKLTVGGAGEYKGTQELPNPPFVNQTDHFIQLDGGAIIWGFQCWFMPEPEGREYVELLRTAGWPIEELNNHNENQDSQNPQHLGGA